MGYKVVDTTRNRAIIDAMTEMKCQIAWTHDEVAAVVKKLNKRAGEFGESINERDLAGGPCGELVLSDQCVIACAEEWEKLRDEFAFFSVVLKKEFFSVNRKAHI